MVSILSVPQVRLCGLTGAITYSRDGVESRVSADAEVWARHIVGDSGGDHDHGHTELAVFIACRLQFQERQEGLRGGQSRGVLVWGVWRGAWGGAGEVRVSTRRKEKRVPRKRERESPGSITTDCSDTGRSHSAQTHWLHHYHIHVEKRGKKSPKKDG